ncbi:uncharacterized protein LOC120347674 [Styela clava]
MPVMKFRMIMNIMLIVLSSIILETSEGKRLYCYQGGESIGSSTAKPSTEPSSWSSWSTWNPEDGPKRFSKDMCCENKEISSEKHTCCMGAKVLKKHFKCCVSGIYVHKSASCECTPPTDWLNKEIKNIGELAVKSKQLNLSLQKQKEKLEILKKLEEQLRRDLKVILNRFDENDELRIVHSLVKCLHEKEADNIFKDKGIKELEDKSLIQRELSKIRSFFKRQRGFSFISNRMDDVSKESDDVARCWNNDKNEPSEKLLIWGFGNMFGPSTTPPPEAPVGISDSAKQVIHEDLEKTENKLDERIRNLIEISLVVEKIENEIKVLSQMEGVFIRSFTESKKVEDELVAAEQEFDDGLPIISRAARSVNYLEHRNKREVAVSAKPCNISGWQYTVQKTQELLQTAEEKIVSIDVFN